jgi:hypothetical protein
MTAHNFLLFTLVVRASANEVKPDVDRWILPVYYALRCVDDLIAASFIGFCIYAEDDPVIVNVGPHWPTVSHRSQKDIELSG